MSPYYSAPVLDRLFEHFVGYSGNPDGLIGIFEQPWFHRELVNVDILRRFPPIILYRPEHTSKFLQVLVNQLVLSQGFEDISIPLECLYHCLMVTSPDQDILHRIGQALSWAMDCADRARNPQVDRNLERAIDVLELVTIVREEESEEEASVSLIVPRSFDFVTDMSDEEWTGWTTEVKALILGTRLGGLGYGPRYSRDRFSRDPDGVCLYGPML
jgi:hypothetical protein